ncbi:unnamed protein product [Amoebophrya sp. A25]|nr:unnamed protein product [Amoebophrya sp. A25]|eukprot:GSA25T00011466001.1
MQELTFFLNDVNARKMAPDGAIRISHMPFRIQLEGNEEYPEDGEPTEISVRLRWSSRDRTPSASSSGAHGGGSCSNRRQAESETHWDDVESGGDDIDDRARTSSEMKEDAQCEGLVFLESEEVDGGGISTSDEEEESVHRESDTEQDLPYLRIIKDATFFQQRNSLSFVERLRQFPHRKELLQYAASRVWPSAKDLAEAVYSSFVSTEGIGLRPPVVADFLPRDETSKKACCMLELGCGLGVTGMVLHKLGIARKTILTDFGEVVAATRANLSLNFAEPSLKESPGIAGAANSDFNDEEHERITAEAFDWRDAAEVAPLLLQRLRSGIAGDVDPDRAVLKRPTATTQDDQTEVPPSTCTSSSTTLLVVCADCVHKPLYGPDCGLLLKKVVEEVLVANEAGKFFDKVEAWIACEHRSPDDGVSDFIRSLRQQLPPKFPNSSLSVNEVTFDVVREDDQEGRCRSTTEEGEKYCDSVGSSVEIMRILWMPMTNS